jgi:ABC-type Co2+ transport system permease subunit
MSKGLENTINTAMVIGIIFLIFAAGVGLSYIVGYIVVEVFHLAELRGDVGYTELGFATMILTAVATIVSYWFYIVIRLTSQKLTGFVKDRYEHKPYECNIFEECKKEE